MTRRELKKRSKELIRPNMPILAFITLLFVLCNLAISYFPDNLVSTICFLILVAFVNTMMAKTTLQISKGMIPDFKNVANDLTWPTLKKIVADIIVYAITAILSFIIAFVYTFSIINVHDLLSEYQAASSFVLAIIFVYVVVMIIECWFAFIPYIALEEPELGIWKTITKSLKMMKGHFWQLLMLNLSFFWWLVLSVCTMGLALFYVLPYMSQAQALFYKQVKNGQLI